MSSPRSRLRLHRSLFLPLTQFFQGQDSAAKSHVARVLSGHAKGKASLLVRIRRRDCFFFFLPPPSQRQAAICSPKFPVRERLLTVCTQHPIGPKVARCLLMHFTCVRGLFEFAAWVFFSFCLLRGDFTKQDFLIPSPQEQHFQLPSHLRCQSQVSLRRSTC